MCYSDPDYLKVYIKKNRKKFEARGMTFYIHIDGAWGGYFASCMHPPMNTVSRGPGVAILQAA